MKKSKSILSFLFASILIIAGVSVFGSQVYDLVAQTPSAIGVSFAAVPLVTVFTKDIQGNLFPDNAFYKQSKDDSAYIDGATVKRPQAGSKPSVSKNRTVLPATIAKRTDDGSEYDIDEYTTDPILIQDTEALVISYDKRKNVLEEHVNKLNEDVANNMANIWLPNGASNIIRTTGANREATAPAATGTRKAITKADFIAAFNQFNKWDIPQDGRFCVLPADMYADILGIEGFVEADKIGSSNLITGMVGKLLNFNIYIRSSVGVYDNTGTPVKKAVGAAGAATDHLAGLFWHKSMVSRAEGSVKVYSDIDKPEYYGSVFSAAVRAGGQIMRNDKKGVLALVQATGV
jgi:hypothetical protein